MQPCGIGNGILRLGAINEICKWEHDEIDEHY